MAWAEGMMFACAAGSYHRAVPTEDELRAGCAELLRGMLGSTADRPVVPRVTAARG